MIIYNYFFHPLARVPGPLTGAVFPFWTMRTLHRRNLNPGLAQLHEKYGQTHREFLDTGPIVRVGPNQLSFTSVEAQKIIYNAKPTDNGADEPFNRSGTLQDVILLLLLKARHIGSLSSRAEHKKIRRRLLPGFTSNALFEQESLLRLHVDNLLHALAQRQEHQGPNDLTEYFSRFLWDFVSDLSFGEPLIQEKKDPHADTLQSLVDLYENFFPLIEAINYAVPQVQGSIRLVLHLIPSLTLGAVLPTATFREYVPNIAVPHCIDRQDGRCDFITHIMGHKSRDPTELKLSYEEMHSNATILTLAAYKSTETIMSALFYRLLATPGVIQELQSELLRNFQSIDDITGKKLLPLPYLNGCVYETLRLTPAVAGKLTSRLSPGAMIDGIYVPAGTEVYTETYSMQRSPRYWHAPDEFRPERWYERGEGSPYARDVHEAFKPFSSGPRACLGKELALQVLRLTAALMVYRFDLKMLDKDRFVWDKDTDSGIAYSNYHVKATVKERV
ncbi:benzoate 4-monooxygenase cytochrome P450 [Aspergillus piperis CBS 112811]|uniref:Benzoate 4-monooxygenase cytochrome P450 n=1 Tax=Aspergillus piperis CBS 112811 TaxID=1448313 RepID=A0A8G1VPY7_9EURO|nr:benzoate 4-monooxygenase cytochrome P450 [Aspergillus piperis CBS 112811]RAH61444.1 benzoate 4-monooxygenase cytochrome P450 [Aspergillus piperis CBS 112811]